MENLFILLELPFDPPENDMDKINAAISAKQNQWSKDMINPVKKAKASEYMAQLGEIKKVMSDAALRKKEAEKAKKIKQGKKKELEEKLKLYHTKGDTLSEKDLKQILRTFSQFGYTEAEIKKAFSKNKGKTETFDPSEVLSSSQANNVKNFLKQLDMEGKTLYDFLELLPSASCSELCEKADVKKKKILAKGTKTGRDNAEQSLCGLCAVIFKDPTNKKKYDNYINLTKYASVNAAIDELALSNQKKIEPRMKESIIDIAVRDYHIGVSDASVYINNYCSYMGYTLHENKLICGLCKAENPMSATICVECGKPLVIICPSCQSENSNAAKTCARCGFDLVGMQRAVILLKEAKQKYVEKRLEEAEKLLKQAKGLWPNHEEILRFEKTISEEKARGVNAISEIMQLIQKKQLYTARTKIEQAKASGFEIDESISSDVNQTIKDVEKKIAKMRACSGDEAFTIALSLSDVITDSTDLNKSLQSFPPKECKRLTCNRVGNSFTFHWDASTSVGDISYVLVRKENTPPNSSNDGSVIYSGRELSYTDSTIKKNKVYYYSVFSIRANVYSCATKLNEAVVIVDTVENVKAVGGDGIVTLSWERASSVSQVKVFQYHGTDKPDETQFEEVPCTRLDGITIKGLVNEDFYWFAVSAGHVLNGNVYFSEKVVVSAIPVKPAKPLENFEVKYEDDIFQAKWERSEWDVVLFWSKQKPSYSIGSIYPLSELTEKYQKIDMSLTSVTSCEFQVNFIGECYIIPAVINGSNVILNESAYVSSVPCVKEVSYDLNSAGTEMYVNFKWPKNIDRVALVYRTDEYPTDYNDALAQKIECSKHQYEMNDGILINNPVQGIYYGIIYTYFDNDGRRIYSEGVRASFSNEPQRDVLYTFKYKKAGFFKKKITLSLTVESNGKFLFPSFVVVHKFKSTPLNRGDGEILCHVEKATEIDSKYTFEFEVPELRPETKLKVFFVNDKNYKSFKIACKSGNSI